MAGTNTIHAPDFGIIITNAAAKANNVQPRKSGRMPKVRSHQSMSRPVMIPRNKNAVADNFRN